MKKKDYPDEELEEVVSEPRNWKGIIIALLVITVICSGISGAILFLSHHLGSEPSKEKLELHEVLGHPEFLNNNSANATWVSEKEILYRDIDGTIFLYDIESLWKTVLASNFSLSRFQVESYTLSADHRYFLLVHDVSSVRSFSTTAKYKVYDTKNSFITSLNITDGSEVQMAMWGPRLSQLLVVSGNNLFYSSRYGVPFVQLTHTGQPGIIYNGMPDLVSEEFVLKKDRAIWWHKTGDKLAYASYDNSYVDSMPVVMYASGVVEASEAEYFEENSDMYPKVVKHPYPKPGRRVCFTTLWVTDLSSLSSSPVTPPKEIQSADHYLIDVTWIDDTTLGVLWSRRSYNRTILSVCRQEFSWTCEKILDEHLSHPRGWLSMDEAPIFSSDWFFMKMPVADGKNGNFDHVVMISTSNSQKRHYLTHGSMVVTKLIAYRSDINTLYYVATVDDDSSVRHVYSVVDMEGEAAKRRQITCLSCELGPGCLFNDAKFSPSGQYIILECLGPGIPRTELRYANNTLIEVLNNGGPLKHWASRKALPITKVYKVPLASGLPARLEVLLPIGLSESDVSHHYPLVLLIDGRPEVQSVNHQFKLNWGHYLASKKDYVVARVDVRGSRYQGDTWKHKIYHHLGQYETEDIISVIKWIRESLAFIDPDKIAIHGKGVGGYIALSILSRASYIRCGAVLSPIFSWKNYAAPFVEKYMGFPSDNNINYEKADITRNLDSIRSDHKQVLFVHGTADRLVSVQNTMLIMKALTNRGVSFKIQLYPDGDDSLYRERMHLHQVIEDLFVSCFRIEDEEDEKYSEMPLNKMVKGGKKILGVTDE